MAVFSVGGNDVGFFELINHCIFRLGSLPCYYAKRHYQEYCDDRFKKSTDAITRPATAEDLYMVYSKTLDNARPQTGRFTLFITGYPRFFATDSRDCDDMSMVYLLPYYK